MITSSIQIVGESQTLTSVEVLVRSLFEYNTTIYVTMFKFPTTLSLEYFCCFTSSLNWGHVGVNGLNGVNGL